MIRSAAARRILLGLTALVFTVIAVLSLLRPHEMAAGFGYRLDGVDALSEHRAVYVGLWLAQAVLLVIALRRVEDAILGDLGALLVLGQVVGRVLSLCLDGVPSARVWPIAILEAAGAVALLLVRPEAARNDSDL